MSNTTILGIDPGTHRLGWGIVTGNVSKQDYIASGCIESAVGTQPGVYLPYIYEQLQAIIQEYNPTSLAIESLLFQKNIKTALSVSEARGVIKLVAAQNNLTIFEFAPNTIKLAVAGIGNASKSEVSRMVGLLLGVKVAGKLDDELDALATAITMQVLNKKYD